MSRLLSIAAILALAAARPETYKETEDFQYARSSTDEGSKSGYYGAQRGNVGGNYERAHNMDALAQSQMSGVMRQVEGELGDGSSTRTGSVFSAANSRGVYGSGHYDLSNLQGRNFQEGETQVGSHSSLSSHNAGYNSQSASALHSSGYNSHLQSSGYSGQHGSRANMYGQSLQAGNLQTADALAYDNGQQATSLDSRYHSQSGYHAQSEYDSHSSNMHSSSHSAAVPQHRLIATGPVRIITRPGSTVAVPVGVQTYDATHSASTVDQNAIASDAELLQHTNYRPTSNAKRYESSYSYRKQWEKHDVKPEIMPLSIPNKNSELYDDAQLVQSSNSQHAIGSNAHTSHSSGLYGGYNSQSQTSLSSQSGYQAAAESHHKSSTSGMNSNAYTQGAYNLGSHSSDALHSGLIDATNTVDTGAAKPKGYQSSYSYHKSWERQGDPYVIKPASGAYVGQASQRLTSASNNQYESHQHGSQSHQGYHSYSNNGVLVDCDCDDEGHVRVARSYNSAPNQYDVYKQGQEYGTTQDLSQQAQVNWGQSEDLSQHAQVKWDNAEDLGQQTQNQWENLEDLGQQTQTQWQDLGQQTQNNFDNLRLIGQETNNKWDKMEDLGQQTENKWDNTADQGQQIQNTWDNLHMEDTQTDLGQQTKDEWNKIKFVSNPEKVEDLTKQVIENETNTAWVGEVKDFQNPWDVELNENQKPDTVKETPSELNKEFIAKFNNDFNQNNHDEQSAWDSTYLYGLPNQEQSDYMGQEAQSTWGVLEFLDQHKTGSVSEKTDDKLGNRPIQGKISEENSSFSYFDHSYTETVNESNNNFHGEFTSNKKTENWSNTGYTYKDQMQGSLSSLWNKITNDDKSSVVETTTYQTDIFVPIEQSKNNSSNWGQEVYGFEDSSNSNFAAHQLWLTKILNETRTSTVRTTTPTTKVAYTTSMTIPTSTTKPIIKSTTMFINEDIGRGDIGPEEIIPEITTEKVRSTFAINNYKNENTGSHNVIGLSAGNNESQSELKTDQSDSTLNVISLNKWLQRNQEEVMQLNNIGISVTTSTLTPLKTTKASYSLSSATQAIQNTYLNNNSHIILDNNEDQHIQTNEDIEHQNIHQENQQIYESSDQQSETVWGQSLEDYLREPTTQDKPQLAENFGMTQRENQNFDRIYQEADTQQVEHFEIVQQSKRDSFYNETKSLPSYQQQNSQKDVQPTEKVENKTMPTEKPGFWKSVGNKFSNAKDKVSSWFRRS